MVTFSVSLAGIPIEIRANCSGTEDLCRAFLTEEKALLSVTVLPEEVEAERETARKDEKTAGQTDSCPMWKFESLALFRKLTEALLPHNVILFHSSVLAYEGKAYLLAAPSGTGKTTHTRLWLKNIPDCHVLNGDKPLLLFKEEGIFACGTPWKGKEQYGVNEILPVGGIALLERAGENSIERIALKDALQGIMKQVHIPAGQESFLQVMRLLRKLCGVPLFRLRCNMDDDAARVSFHGMIK